MGAVKAPSALEWESLRLRVFSVCKGANILKKDGKVLQVDQRRPAWAEDTQTQEVLVEGPQSEEPEGRWGFALCLETWTCAEPSHGPTSFPSMMLGKRTRWENMGFCILNSEKVSFSVMYLFLQVDTRM